jgi:cytochrome oxidase assembly protein ShyY1
MRIRFRFKWIPFVAAALLVVLGVSLGLWQERRAAQKVALQAMLSSGNAAVPLVLGPQPVTAADVEFRRIAVTGQFVPDWALYLDNRPYQGRAGFYVLMPFRIDGSNMHVLVERGWLPRNIAQRDALPPYATPSGTVTIAGIARENASRVMQLGTPPPLRGQAIVQNADIGQVASASGLLLQPFVILQTGLDDQLVRDWPAPDTGVDKHRGYAFQWYALALMAFLFFVLTGLRRGTK